MTKRKVSWEGAFPANVTPFTKDGDIDEALLRENIRMTVDEGAHGIVVCGHNAEAHLMTPEEELLSKVDGAVKSCWPMACLYRSLRFGEEYLPVSALLVDKT